MLHTLVCLLLTSNAEGMRVWGMRLWMKSSRMCNAARRHGDAMSTAIDPTGRPLLTGLDQLPGDPSLVLNVNVNLGEGKPAFMASASKAISSA